MNSYICRECLQTLRTSQRRCPSLVRFYSSAGRTRPFRLGVIGSGPAGFYSAYRVMQKIPGARVDMYEQLPVPFGLVRYGVAPDHPEVKNCQDKFEEVAESERFTFVGNVSVGLDIPLPDLARHYDALLFAYGASEDRALGIPGEDLEGILSARAFVGWYNGLPGYRDMSLDAILGRAENAVIIGQGNVALDVARVLLTDVDILRKTDMATHAVEALSKSKVKRVQVIGRRGPIQAACTIKELRELMTLPSVSFDPIPEPPMPSSAEIASLPRQQKRIAQLLAKGSSNAPASSAKSWSLDFLLSPSRFLASDSDKEALGSISLIQNQFTATADTLSRSAAVEPIPNAPPLTVPTPLAFRSVGYKSSPLPTLSDINVPFDTSRGIVPNDVYGRILADPEETGHVGAPQPVPKHVPGMYCAGWVKRGPTGVIAATMEDAFSTADAIAMDWEAGAPFIEGAERCGWGWEGLRKEVLDRGVRAVDWVDWKRIDTVEKERGKAKGKEREKIADVKEMLKVLDG